MTGLDQVERNRHSARGPRVDSRDRITTMAINARNVRYSHGGGMRSTRPGRAGWRASLIVAAAIAALPAVALAETTTITIGETYGLTHLPSYVIVDQRLIEKEAAARGLGPVKVEFTRVGNGNVVANLLLAGRINVAMSGLVPFLYLWDKTRAQQPIKAIAALSQSNI